jgi:hypothetical protein
VGSGSSFTCFECDTGADSCKRIKYNIKIQITDETDHKSMCWLNAEELCKAHNGPEQTVQAFNSQHYPKEYIHKY